MQAVLWIASYGLYLVYTTAAITYDVLPAVFPGLDGPWQPLLEATIPAALVAIVLAGRDITLAAFGVLAVGQLVLVGVLAAVSVGHGAPASTFTPAAAPAGEVTTATAEVSLLFVCGSLPLFLGGDVSRPTRSLPRALVTGVALVAAAVTVAVFPLAANPAFTRAELPGVAVAQVFSGRSLAIAVGVGIAASAAGLMLVEILALTRLVHAVTARSQRAVTVTLAAAFAVSGPVTLLDPRRIYADLVKPSLVLLWASQLIVFAVYPRFRRIAGAPRWRAIGLAASACAFAGYGLYSSLSAAGS